jgi:uncharacterized membrane protein
VKDSNGFISEKQAVDEGPVGTGLGLLTGSLIGLLAGPVGLAVGASAGTLTGMIYDLGKSGIDISFVDEVSKALVPGKTALLAEVDESWVTPVDTRLGKLDGLIFRRLRSEVIEDQLARESAEFNAEMKQLKEELALTRAEDKAAVQKEIENVKKKLEVMQTQAKAKMEQGKNEMNAKVNTMREQEKQASARHKAKLEKRMAEIKADYAKRSAKLEQAGKLVREAVTP